MYRRLTMQNPSRTNYRLPCACDTPELHAEMMYGYPTLFGEKINILGKLEDAHPLEWYLENMTKK